MFWYYSLSNFSGEKLSRHIFYQWQMSVYDNVLPQKHNRHQYKVGMPFDAMLSEPVKNMDTSTVMWWAGKALF